VIIEVEFVKSNIDLLNSIIINEASSLPIVHISPAQGLIQEQESILLMLLEHVPPFEQDIFKQLTAKY